MKIELTGSISRSGKDSRCGEGMTTVRRRHELDILDCAEVLRAVYEKDGYPVQGVDDAEAFLRGKTVRAAWVAVKDGKIIGHVSAGDAPDDDVSVALWRRQRPADRVAVLGRLFVHPEHRSSGAASSLVQEADAWSRTEGLRLLLFALVKDQAAINLYHRLSWVKYGTMPYAFGEGELMNAVCFANPSDET